MPCTVSSLGLVSSNSPASDLLFLAPLQRHTPTVQTSGVKRWFGLTISLHEMTACIQVFAVMQ